MTFRASPILLLASGIACQPGDRGTVRTDSVPVLSAAPDPKEAAGSAGTPLTAGDFVVVGLRALMDSMAVVRTLGQPVSRSLEGDFRAPGAKMVSWHYRDLIILMGSSNSLGGIWITGPSITTARGLRVGDAPERVKALYGAPQHSFRNEWEYAYRGRVTGDVVVRVSFMNGRVKRLYVGHLYD